MNTTEQGRRQKAPVAPAPSAGGNEIPLVIAKAIMDAIALMSEAQTTADEEVGTGRSFRYLSAANVLNAVHGPLLEAGLHVQPIEVSYAQENVDQSDGSPPQAWAHYGYQFRIIHKTGISWVDERDTRHVSIQISGSGASAGKAQSLAWRDYLRSLLRIRGEDEDGAPRTTTASAAVRAAPRKGTIAFDFGSGSPEWLLPAEVLIKAESVVAPLRRELRQEWLDANVAAMRQLQEISKPVWLKVCRIAESGRADAPQK